ncbi:hypothetical protein ACIQW9_01590 [Herminiimonas sp. NPDC097707]|uniref:hypothetical protein n=1 Tax=Herminiimonas sp. NPDC097707 TaxID=3364007 RepID=UPI00383B4AA6
MKITEVITVKNAAGKALTLQHLVPGITYLDYGFTHLPRDFNGYRVKDTDRTAVKQSNGTFKLSDSSDLYKAA